ncbi:MAG: hypothetical protein ACKOA8_16900, partial [Deltaproteobacteria bacterium]
MKWLLISAVLVFPGVVGFRVFAGNLGESPSEEVECRLGEQTRHYQVTTPNPYVCKLYFKRNGKAIPSSRSLWH